MAIYHCSAKTIGRSSGSSAVNSAAYRSGEKLYDQRLDKTFYYAGKILDVMHKEIMAPDKKLPSWVHNRESLWNQVEFAEKRKDSQLAREVEISLPREFTTDQNIALVREYVQKEFVDKGMIADVCLHYGRKGDSYNPHAHVMLTMREIDESGFGKKNIEWNKRELLKEWRESWANLSNKHLALNGHDLKIDHRSLKEQGIELKPQNVELANDAKERLTEQRERQLSIMRENGERLLEKPEIALKAITQSQSTFTNRDIARYLHSRTADNEQFQAVFDKVKLREEIVKIAFEKNQARYTTKEMLDIERQLFKDAAEKSMEHNFAVKEITLSDNLSSEQKAAVEYICQDKGLCSVVGYAGTGKTHMLGEAREIWEANGYRVRGIALSGIAAQGLERGAGIKSCTVARVLIDWENGREALSKKDILVIDEAGMIGTRDMARIVGEARGKGAKLVGLGDPQQLQAIGAGAAFRGVVERDGYLEMSDVRRQDKSWQSQATKDFAMGKTQKALDTYANENKIQAFETKELAINEMVKMWAENRSSQETQIILSYKRADVAELNKQAREVLKGVGELDHGIDIKTTNGKKEFSKGDQIYFLRNDNGLEVKNGTLGNVLSIEKDGNIKVQINEPSGDRELSFNFKDYNYIDHGYATTIHKSQGITADKSYIFASKGFDLHLTYVAMSRHVKDVQVFYSKEEFSSLSELKYHLSREAIKDNALDYIKTAKDFAKVRGIEAYYKDIEVQHDTAFSVTKDHQGSFDQVNVKNIMGRLEQRVVFKRGLKKIEKMYGCKLNRDLSIGENMRYFADEKIGKQEYALMTTDSQDNMKLVPREICRNIQNGSYVEIYKTADSELIAGPSENELWVRKVKNVETEFGKKMTRNIEDGEMGRYRGVIDYKDREFVIMEQYDKLALINKNICEKGIKEGDYMKIEKAESLDREDGQDNKLRAVHDKKTEKALEQQKVLEVAKMQEKSKDFEISL